MPKDRQNYLTATYAFSRFLAQRFREDRILLHSGYLSFVTLLSLVPLVTVVFSALSLFPVFQTWREEIEKFVLRNFIPASGEIIEEHLGGFVENASQMTPIGVTVLIIVALLLVSSVDRALNQIWRTSKPRRVIVSFSIYWVVLTLGPLLIGASLVVTSYLISLTEFTESTFIELRAQVLGSLPFLASVLAFLLLYLLVPNKVVHVWNALTGAVIAAVLFELSKSAFAFYLTHFPSYQAIYGALAAIPILFVWVYVSWVVTLVGAEIAASLDAFFSKDQDTVQEQEHQSGITTTIEDADSNCDNNIPGQGQPKNKDESAASLYH